MATTQQLVVSNDGQEVRMHLNDQEQIFIEQISDDPVHSLWMTINKEDWAEIKAFIDAQFGVQHEAKPSIKPPGGFGAL